MQNETADAWLPAAPADELRRIHEATPPAGGGDAEHSGAGQAGDRQQPGTSAGAGRADETLERRDQPGAGQPDDGSERAGADRGAQAGKATGEPTVDAALRALDGLGQVPVTEHPAIFEDVHARIQEVLGELESGPAAGAGSRRAG
jgi:hypothetical protein